MVMELVEAEVDVNYMEEVSVTFYYCISTSAIYTVWNYREDCLL